MTSPLVSAAWLVDNLDREDLRVCDVRWYLDDPGRGRRLYGVDHIAGAVFLDIEADLSGWNGGGRHPLPDPEVLAARLGELGIGSEHFVVGYDDVGGVTASRLWWLLRHLGHEKAGVVDGGYQAWRQVGGPISNELPAIAAARFETSVRSDDTIERADLAGLLGSIDLIDARSAERYVGEEEPVDPKAGHIPSARNIPFALNLTSAGMMRPAEELAELYSGIDEDAVFYCGSGVSACHDLLAMAVAGLPVPRLYPGSWSDWASTDLPIAGSEVAGSEVSPA